MNSSVNDLGVWLTQIGLSEYASIFAQNDIELPCRATPFQTRTFRTLVFLLATGAYFSMQSLSFARTTKPRKRLKRSVDSSLCCFVI